MAAPGRVDRDKQGARGTSSKHHTDSWPHLELGRLRLKTWSESDFSIAETWPTHLHIYTTGASPRRAVARLGSAHTRNYMWIVIRTPVIGKSRLQMRQYCQGVRTLKVCRVWMMKRTKPWESYAMNHSNHCCHPAHDDEQQLQQQQQQQQRSSTQSSSRNTSQMYRNKYSYVVQQRITQ